MSVLRRIKRVRVKTCATCGAPLQPNERDKYDPFWILISIFAGAVMAFYLVGIAIMAIGLSLLRQQQVIWGCPKCSPVITPA